MQKTLIILSSFLFVFWGVFFLLQNKEVYDSTLGKFTNNWVNENGEIKFVKEPFQQVNNDNCVRWDAVHYNMIRNHGYSVVKEGDLIFAFFPLFPLVWKISGLPPLGIPLLNYLLFSISILLLRKIFLTKKNFPDKDSTTLIVISLPSIIVFLIPYTEALFLLSITIGLLGFVKKKYWVFFIGFFLASLTRSSFVFLFISIIVTELFFYTQYRKILSLIKNVF